MKRNPVLDRLRLKLYFRRLNQNNRCLCDLCSSYKVKAIEELGKRMNIAQRSVWEIVTERKPNPLSEFNNDVLKAMNMSSEQLDLNDSLEDMNSLTFEVDNLNMDGQESVKHITHHSSRFASVSSQEIQGMFNNSMAKSTRRNTSWAMNIFRDWCVERDVNVELERMSFDELNKLLSKFYVEVRQEKGEQYSKSGLRGLRYGIERYLKEHVPSFKNVIISRHPSFVESNKVLNVVLKTLKRNSKSVVHRPIISKADLLKLGTSGVLSSQSPLKLVRAVWFYVSMYLCPRGCDGQRQLTTSSFEIIDDGDGRKYAKMSHQEATKNRQGGEIERSFEQEAKMYSVDSILPGGEDPVGLLELYLSKVNPKCKAFFQKPINCFTFDDNIWFEKRPIQINSLANMMKEISKAASLSEIYTNFSVRATAKKTLLQNRQFMAIFGEMFGHPNEQSFPSNNNRPPKEHLMECSDINSPRLNVRAPSSVDTQQRESFSVNQMKGDKYVQAPTSAYCIWHRDNQQVTNHSKSDLLGIGYIYNKLPRIAEVHSEYENFVMNSRPYVADRTILGQRSLASEFHPRCSSHYEEPTRSHYSATHGMPCIGVTNKYPYSRQILRPLRMKSFEGREKNYHQNLFETFLFPNKVNDDIVDAAKLDLDSHLQSTLGQEFICRMPATDFADTSSYLGRTPVPVRAQSIDECKVNCLNDKFNSTTSCETLPFSKVNENCTQRISLKKEFDSEDGVVEPAESNGEVHRHNRQLPWSEQNIDSPITVKLENKQPPSCFESGNLTNIPESEESYTNNTRLRIVAALSNGML